MIKIEQVVEVVSLNIEEIGENITAIIEEGSQVASVSINESAQNIVLSIEEISETFNLSIIETEQSINLSIEENIEIFSIEVSEDNAKSLSDFEVIALAEKSSASYVYLESILIQINYTDSGEYSNNVKNLNYLDGVLLSLTHSFVYDLLMWEVIYIYEYTNQGLVGKGVTITKY